MCDVRTAIDQSLKDIEESGNVLSSEVVEKIYSLGDQLRRYTREKSKIDVKITYDCFPTLVMYSASMRRQACIGMSNSGNLVKIISVDENNILDNITLPISDVTSNIMIQMLLLWVCEEPE